MKVVEYLIEKIICPFHFKWRKGKNSIFFKLPVYTNNAFYIKIRWKIFSKHYFKHVIYLWKCMLSHSVISNSCDHMDWSPPGFSLHGILQAKILEWVAILFSRGSSWPRNQTWVSHIVRRFFTIWATREAPIEIKCTINVMPLNCPQTILLLLQSVEKLSSMTPGPGAKKVGNCCHKALGPSPLPGCQHRPPVAVL